MHAARPHPLYVMGSVRPPRVGGSTVHVLLLAVLVGCALVPHTPGALARKTTSVTTHSGAMMPRPPDPHELRSKGNATGTTHALPSGTASNAPVYGNDTLRLGGIERRSINRKQRANRSIEKYFAARLDRRAGEKISLKDSEKKLIRQDISALLEIHRVYVKNLPPHSVDVLWTWRVANETTFATLYKTQPHCKWKGVICSRRRGGMHRVTEIRLISVILPVLSPALTKLTALRKLSLRFCKLENLPVKVFKSLPRLRYLELKDNALRDLPDDMFEGMDIRILNLGGNHLLRVPSSVWNMRNLRFAWLGSNNITDLNIPAAPKATKLKTLDISINPLRELPTRFGVWKNLETLRLFQAQLSAMPPVLSMLTTLRSLHAQSNNLTNIPDSFAQLTRLKDLRLNWNSFTEFPPVLLRMNSLRQLGLNNNQLSALPRELFLLPSLLMLDVGHNNLTTLDIPEFVIPAAYKLGDHVRVNEVTQKLGLEHSTHKSRPYFVTFMGVVTATSAAGGSAVGVRVTDLVNQKAAYAGLDVATRLRGRSSIITVARENVRPFDHGTIFSLLAHGNRLISLGEIGRLWNLRLLDVRDNMLTKLPDSLGDVRPFSKLSVQRNMLTELPASFSKLKALDQIAARQNNLGRDFGRLHANRTVGFPSIEYLEKVDLAVNRLAKIPQGLMDSRAILSLNLNRNGIRRIPTRLWRLRRIKTLQLQRNLLSALPTQLQRLPSLTFVDLRYNNISSVPLWADELRRLAPRLRDLLLTSNPIDTASLPPFFSGKSYGLKLGAHGLMDAAGEYRYVTEGNGADSLKHNDTQGSQASQEVDCMVYNMAPQKGQNSFGLLVKTQIYKCLCHGFGEVGSCHRCPLNGAECRGGKLYCRSGSFVSSDDPYGCTLCPSGGMCVNNTLTARPGYWMTSRGRNKVYECPREESCPGGYADCAHGYKGNLCATCVSGYFSTSSGACLRCPNVVSSFVWLGFTLLGIGLVLVLFFFSQWAPSATNITLTKWKILVGFVQILSVLGSTYKVPWPDVLTKLSDMFSWVNFEVFKASSIECLYPEAAGRFNYFDLLVMYLCVPPAFVLLLVHIYAFAYLWRRFFGRQKHFIMLEFRNKLIRSASTGLLFFYLPVSAKGLRFFKCMPFDDGEWWLEVDYSIRCFHGKWNNYVIVAVLNILFYTVGIPVLLFSVLMWNRKQLNKPHIYARFGSLYEAYKKETPWWEIEELLRKLLIGAVAVFFTENGALQVATSILICFFAFGIQMHFQPFAASSDNRMQILGLVMIMLTLAMGLMHSIEVPPYEAEVIAYVVCSADLANIGAVIASIFADVFVNLQALFESQGDLLKMFGGLFKFVKAFFRF